MIRTSAAVVGAAVAGLLALSACAAKTDAQRDPDPAAAAAAEEEAGDSQSVKLAVRQVGSLGSVVTDQNGRTLYRFDKDKAKPSASNCNEDCAVAWPPVVVTDLSEVKLSNVNKSLVGLVERQDGSKQVTLGGWPLYLFKDDKKAGDAKGQGLNGTWFASTPEGKKAPAAAPKPETTTTKPAPAAPPTDPGYGY